MKARHIGACVCLIAISMCVAVSAHPGRTDSNGGHYNRSTGEYHYHHGYPEHQHTNGVCPYDYDDKTGEGSGGNSDGGTSGDSRTVITPTETYLPIPEAFVTPEITSVSSQENESSFWDKHPVIELLAILVSIPLQCAAFLAAFWVVVTIITGLINLFYKIVEFFKWLFKKMRH